MDSTDLNEVLVFAKVVQAGSFTAAARALGLPKSTVSRKVSQLEASLGARLLQRTTRTLSLTDAGRTYHSYASRIASELEEARQAVTSQEESPRGLLRMTAPLGFAFLGAVVARFMTKYPDVRVELVCSDRLVDLVDEAFDLAIRAGRLADSSLIARSLCGVRSYLVASPVYLEKHGKPRTPADLERHDGLLFAPSTARGTWRLENKGKLADVAPRPRYVANDIDLLHDAAVAGLGIALLPTPGVSASLKTGKLKRVLPSWPSPETPVHAVYPSTRHLSMKVRAMIDHLEVKLEHPPWEKALRAATD